MIKLSDLLIELYSNLKKSSFTKDEASMHEEERTKGGKKLNKAYLTKDKAAMKRSIDRVAKLSDDDPSAYGKWDADYSDKAKKKPYKTRKSSSTIAYQKRFGKKEKK
jgi:hypothetical protein